LTKKEEILRRKVQRKSQFKKWEATQRRRKSRCGGNLKKVLALEV